MAPVFTGRGVDTAREHGCQKMAPVFTGAMLVTSVPRRSINTGVIYYTHGPYVDVTREHGPWTRVVCTEF